MLRSVARQYVMSSALWQDAQIGQQPHSLIHLEHLYDLLFVQFRELLKRTGVQSLVAGSIDFAAHLFHNIMLTFFKFLIDILRPWFFGLVRLLGGWISRDPALLRQVVKQI